MDEEPGVEWSHFGLDRQPFRPAVDPSAYFPAASHEAARTALAEAFGRRDPIVLIDGADGVGKTIVARKWLEDLVPDVPRAVVPNSRAAHPIELLQAILFDLALPYQGLSEQETRLALTGHLLDRASECPYPTVIVLDEAHHLGESALEELRSLGNLETRRGAALFAVLVASPALRETLIRPGLQSFAQRLDARVAIEPLTAEESAEYIRHQICAAGGDPERVFAADAMPLLVNACRGIPRLVNRAAARSLELAAAGEAEAADVEAVLEALDRLGLAVPDTAEPALLTGPVDPVLLPHPARTVGPARSRRGKSAASDAGDEAAAPRGSKDKRKRTA
jgi:type II secretory pathway predicted ATPase ExeA